MQLGHPYLTRDQDSLIFLELLVTTNQHGVRIYDELMQ